MSILTTFLNLVPVTLAQSLIYAFVAVAIVITFRILDFADLTSEGAFPLGGSVAAKFMILGYSPTLSLLAGAGAGFLAGCFTAAINIRFKINSLLAGILVITMLYSVNLRILGRSNVALFQFDNVFSYLTPGLVSALVAKLIVVGFALVLVALVLKAFMDTEKGIAFRATGSNPTMAEAQGINVRLIVVLGVGLAGALSATAGAFLVQSQGYADVNIGIGVLVGGLAAVIIGETVVKPRTVTRQLLAPIVGTIIYFQLISLCLALGFPPSDLKLASGTFVLIMLAVPTLRIGRRPLPKTSLRLSS